MRRISSTEHGRGAGDREAQRRHVEVGDARVVEDRLVHRRRPGQHRDALLGDALHHRVDVEHRVRDDRRALDRALARMPGLQPERVEERVDDEVAVAGAQADDGRPRVVRLHARRVREHRALGPAGGARREEDVGEVVAVSARSRRDLRRGRLVGAREEVVPADRAVGRRAAQHDDLLERRHAARPRAAARRSWCRGSR